MLPITGFYVSGQFSYSSFFEQVCENSIWVFAGIIIVLLIVSIIYLFITNRPSNAKAKSEVSLPKLIKGGSKQVEALNKDLAPYGFAYERYQDVFYSINNCWQRKFGYCRLYDEACAPISLIVDCEPIRFEYNGIKWLIQFWKGQYGMTSGGEVGIYYTKGADLNIPGLFDGTFYYSVSDKDRINMAFALKKNDNLLFTRSGFHWWLTGFKLGEFSSPSELSMDIILELYNTDMCKAFVDALQKVGYTTEEFSVNGRRVNIKYTKPHSQQPISRTSFTEFIMQRNNESFCKTYENLTKNYPDTLQKLQVLKLKSPKLYKKVLNPGKSPLIYDSFKKISEYVEHSEDKGED